MARYEGKIEADGTDPLELDRLLVMLGEDALKEGAAQGKARACYLSSSDGWREAVKELNGAFAAWATLPAGREK